MNIIWFFAGIIMHHIFGRQYRFGILSTQYITENYMQSLAGRINARKTKDIETKELYLIFFLDETGI